MYLHCSAFLNMTSSRALVLALPLTRRSSAHQGCPSLSAKISGVSPRLFLLSTSKPYLLICSIIACVIRQLPVAAAWCRAVLPLQSWSSQAISLSWIMHSTNLTRCLMHAWENTEMPNASFWWTPAPWWSKMRPRDSPKGSLSRSQTRRIGVRMRESNLFTLHPTFARRLTCREFRRVMAWWREHILVACRIQNFDALESLYSIMSSLVGKWGAVSFFNPRGSCM